MAIELSTPSFKPREYEGEYIRYTLYGLDSGGDELDDLITSPKKSTVTHTIKELLPDYGRVYNGMHVVAILYDKNDRRLDSEVVWSTDQNESKGADETIEYEKGHKNSRGEDAPWVIRDHKGGKVLASFPSEDAAKAHLARMKNYAKASKDEKLFNVKDLEAYAMNGYKAAVSAAWSGAGVKNFKIDIRSNDGEPPTIDVWPKTLDGKDLDVSWRILPKIFKIAQYSISPVGNHDIEREMDFRTEDDIENIFTDEFKNLDAVMDDGKPAKTETAPDDYARDNFLKGALDYAEIEDDKGNVVLLKIVKRYANEIGGDFCLRSYDGETDKSLAMGGIRYVVNRYGELIDMDPADAILEIAKE